MATDVSAYIDLLPEQLPPDPAREWKINHPGKIDKHTSQVLIGVFTAFATIAVALRIIVHLRKRGRLFVDDYLVFFATACLLVETGVLYHNLHMMYVEATLAHDPNNIALFTRGDLQELINDYLKWNNIYIAFAWTTNYVIKLSFLAFFRVLVRDVSRGLNWYWWFVLCFTVASWLFNFTENMILCGASKSLKCFPYPRYNLEMGGASTAADIITDIMIVSIPILLLHKTQLRLSHKIRILTFLCLSIVMVALALARLIHGLTRDYSGVLTFSMIWTHLWLHLESSVAVLMGGVTAFRTVFARQVRDDDKAKGRRSNSTLYEYVLRFFGKSRPADSEISSSVGEKKEGFLQGPRTGASLKGLRTFIRRHDREPGHTTVEDTMASCTYDPLESYHNFKRHEDGNQKTPSSTTFQGSGSIEDYEMPGRPLPVLQTHNMV